MRIQNKIRIDEFTVKVNSEMNSTVKSENSLNGCMNDTICESTEYKNQQNVIKTEKISFRGWNILPNEQKKKKNNKQTITNEEVLSKVKSSNNSYTSGRVVENVT